MRVRGRKGSLGGLGPQGSPQWQKVVTCCRGKDVNGGDKEFLNLTIFSPDFPFTLIKSKALTPSMINALRGWGLQKKVKMNILKSQGEHLVKNMTHLFNSMLTILKCKTVRYLEKFYQKLKSSEIQIYSTLLEVTMTCCCYQIKEEFES